MQLFPSSNSLMLFEYKEDLLYYVGDQALEHIAQRGYGLSLTGDTQEPSQCRPVPGALG